MRDIVGNPISPKSIVAFRLPTTSKLHIGVVHAIEDELSLFLFGKNSRGMIVNKGIVSINEPVLVIHPDSLLSRDDPLLQTILFAAGAYDGR